MAQRDSAVSDYNPCAEEPPAQSASLWCRNRTYGSGGTRAQRNLCRERETVRGKESERERDWGREGVLPRSISGKGHSRTEDISSSALFIFGFFLLLFSPVQDTQLRSLLDERELGTSLGKTKPVLL